MLRSKYHRPWQPRANDGQVFNPFASGGGTETSFSENIEEAEGEAQGPETPPASAATELIGDTGDPVSTATLTAADPPAKQSWYERFRDRFSRH